jgi:thymidylate synthase
MIYKDLLRQGKEVCPRGLKILEIENYNYCLPPYTRFIAFEARKLNVDYIKKEFLWYLAGNKFDTTITNHAKMWKGLVNKDGSINSNYGSYIWGEIKQFDNVVKILTDDKDSRRASIVILNQSHLLSDTHDVPCTYSINFRIRENKLNMTVRMRSQDAIYGMGNDVPCFSFIHEMMYHMLHEVYHDLGYGLYYHSCDSFHIYEKHFKMLKSIVNQGEWEPVTCPKMLNADEVRFIRGLDFSRVPSEYLFTQWLIKSSELGIPKLV